MIMQLISKKRSYSRLLMHSAGQSNLIVQGASQSQIDQPISNGYYWNGSAFVNINNNTSGHGVEIPLSAYYLNDLYWTKIAHGSSEIDEWQKGETYYSEMLTDLQGAKTALDLITTDYEIAFYWNQWEGDSNSEALSLSYKAKFLQMVSDLELDTSITFDKILMTQPLTTAKTIELGYTRTYADNVREQVQSIKDDSILTGRVFLVDIDDVVMQSDGVHYDSDWIDSTLYKRLKVHL